MISELQYTNHDEWLALRKNFIGGSDAASVLGLNPYSSPYALWAEKLNLTPGFEGNLSTRTGTYLEDFVAKLFEEETGKKVRRKNRMLVNDKYPFACADVDRLVNGEKALLEIKTTTSLPNMRKFRNGEYPDTWYCQVMHYLAITELPRAYLAVLVQNREFLVFTIERDEDEIAALMQTERDFWFRNVIAKRPPEIDGSDATADTVKQIFGESVPGSSMSLAGYESMLARRATLKASMKELEDEIRLIDTTITAQMGACESASCGTWKISWKPQSRTSFDRKALERDYPDIPYQSYTTTTSSRTLRITGGK